MPTKIPYSRISETRLLGTINLLVGANINSLMESCGFKNRVLSYCVFDDVGHNNVDN